MSSFPFPDLLTTLERESDRTAFVKAVGEVGLNRADQELGKLLRTLQFYKGCYELIPREIRAVHEGAISEISGLRDEVREFAARVAEESGRVADWAESIHQSLQAVQPEAVAQSLQRKLLEETMAAVGGSAQALISAYGRIDKATGTLNAAASQAEASIQQWQIVTLRRVWISAFFFCTAVNAIASACAWLFFLKR